MNLTFGVFANVQFLAFFLVILSITTMAQFNNLVLDITREATPDPYITYANGAFYLVCCNISVTEELLLT